jgi:alpha-1,3-mannosyltransferase
MVIHGVTIKNFSSRQAFEYIEQCIETESKLLLAFANAHTINEANSSLAFKNVLGKFTVLPDGVGVDLAAKYKYGKKFKENLNGTDFVPAFLKQSHKKRIYLVGGKEGIAEKVLATWSSRYPQHEWVGAHHGYLNDGESMQLCKEVSELDIDVLIVAMGNPKQELWISEYANLHDAKISIGVGALFDFVAGEAKRAPKWVRRFRLEWVYRLYKEPIRLGKRYLVGNPAFIIRTLFTI